MGRIPKQRWLIASVVASFALIVAAIVIQNYFRVRTTPASNAFINSPRQIDAAIQQWALESQKKPDDKLSVTDITPYLSRELQCPQGGKHTVGPAVSNGVFCSFPSHVLPQ
jgi:hypothetical protein